MSVMQILITIQRHNWEYQCEVTDYTPDTSASDPEGGYTAEAEYTVIGISPKLKENSKTFEQAEVDDLIDSTELEHLIITACIEAGY